MACVDRMRDSAYADCVLQHICVNSALVSPSRNFSTMGGVSMGAFEEFIISYVTLSGFYARASRVQRSVQI